MPISNGRVNGFMTAYRNNMRMTAMRKTPIAPANLSEKIPRSIRDENVGTSTNARVTLPLITVCCRFGSYRPTNEISGLLDLILAVGNHRTTRRFVCTMRHHAFCSKQTNAAVRDEPELPTYDRSLGGIVARKG